MIGTVLVQDIRTRQARLRLIVTFSRRGLLAISRRLLLPGVLGEGCEHFSGRQVDGTGSGDPIRVVARALAQHRQRGFRDLLPTSADVVSDGRE